MLWCDKVSFSNLSFVKVLTQVEDMSLCNFVDLESLCLF